MGRYCNFISRDNACIMKVNIFIHSDEVFPPCDRSVETFISEEISYVPRIGEFLYLNSYQSDILAMKIATYSIKYPNDYKHCFYGKGKKRYCSVSDYYVVKTV